MFLFASGGASRIWRLEPKIDILKPERKLQEKILRLKCPEVAQELSRLICKLLKTRQQESEVDSIRDMLTLARSAQRLRSAGVADPLEKAATQVRP